MSSFDLSTPYGSTDLYKAIHDSPNGSVHIIGYVFQTTDVGEGHAIVAYRGPRGIHLVPTATLTPMNRYSALVTEAITFQGDFSRRLRELAGAGVTSMLSADVVTLLKPLTPKVYSQKVSFGDCTGSGPNRRGNSGAAGGASANRCSSSAVDRCIVQ